MSTELQAIRQRLRDEARRKGREVSGALTTKGVHFGVLRVMPDGSVDTSEIEDVHADLVIRPFGWKGTFETIRDFVAESLQIQFGIQCADLLADHRGDPDPDLVGTGADPDDPDGDGVTNKLTGGQVTALVLFLAMQELPGHPSPGDTPRLQTSSAAAHRTDRDDVRAEVAAGTKALHEARLRVLPQASARPGEPGLADTSKVTGEILEIDLSRHGEHSRLAG